ncbi:MAG: hypothetical protein M5U26_26715 [Planctomycetota bacterium]|nr:hypothetical protein [Planctomycetota bacterium]
MLREDRDVRQLKGEPRRRWFSDATFDLIVWHDEQGWLAGFQLCYRVGGPERAIQYFEGLGYTHRDVDEGDVNEIGHKSAPILVAGGPFKKDLVIEAFRRASEMLDPPIAGFVLAKLRAYE